MEIPYQTQHRMFYVEFSKSLEQLLGFDQPRFDKKSVYTGNRIADLNLLDCFFVYLDILEPRIVGDVKTQVLTMVATQGKSGESRIGLLQQIAMPSGFEEKLF